MRVVFGIPAAAALIGLVVCAPAQAQTLRGTVTQVKDGDTVRVKVGPRTRTYNLAGVDAPDPGDCYGRQAQNRLKRLVHRKAVRVRIVRGRSVELLRGRTNINRALVAGGYARALAGGGKRGARLRGDEARARTRGRGLHRACAAPRPPADPAPPAPPPPANAGDLTGQPAIAELTNNLTCMGFRRSTSGSGSTTTIELHLCAGGAFRYWSVESFSSDGSFLNLRNESLGQGWRVSDAVVKADGSRTAVLQGTVVSEATGDGPRPVTEPQASVRVDFAGGQWHVDGQPVLAFPGAASCAPRLSHG